MKKLMSITVVVCCFFIVGCSDDNAKTETSITSSTETLNRSELPDVSDVPIFTKREEVVPQKEKTPEEIARDRRVKERQEALNKKLDDEIERVREKSTYSLGEGAI